MREDSLTPFAKWPSRGQLRPIVLSRFGNVRMGRAALLTLLVAIALYVSAFAVRIVARKYYIFLPSYVARTMHPAVAFDGPTHVFVLFTDHFEPRYDERAVAAWLQRYDRLAARHHDRAGRPPQHTFFYPAEQSNEPIYRLLQSAAQSGLGEVELHLHHDHDTVESMRGRLREMIADFQRFGFLRTIDGRTHFAFIHGNWGLDNSKGAPSCGVNTELRLLHDFGCFADFTFPSIYEDSQPSNVNSIYAAHDDPEPKSYDRVLPVSALRDGRADLMIFQGPLYFAPSLHVRRLFLDLDDGNIHGSGHGSAARVDRWVRANVHVPERPEWIFVKLFGHCASSPEDTEACLGRDFDETLSYLEARYSDGRNYVLHYVTAREAYNLARAAGEGASGDPNQYLDAYVQPYVANAVAAGRRSSAGQN